MTEFLHVVTSGELIERLEGFPAVSHERLPLDASLTLTLAEDVTAAEDLPPCSRSTVDGYAVRARDTFGASDSVPSFLKITGSVNMGTMPDLSVGWGEAAYIPTGGFLPSGADAVVMVEYTNLVDTEHIEVTRPVPTKANILDRGEDVKAGDTVLAKGKILRPQELGLLAGLGVTEVPVYRRPRAAVISTGDEVVPIDRKPKPGQIRDANGYSIAALVRQYGGEPLKYDIVPDDAGMLHEALERALVEADLAVLSGGSSVGARDVMVDAVMALPGVEVLAHGVSIRPGKPTLVARHRGKAIFGLPGHPVSALIVAQVFLAPFLRSQQGGGLRRGPLGYRTRAVLGTSMHSTIGLEDFVRVRLEALADGTHLAQPVFGKSSMLSTMARADGLIVVPLESEGLLKGETVEVIEV